MNDNRTRKATEAARLLFKFAEMGFGIKHAHLNLSDAGGGDEKSDRVRKLGAITIYGTKVKGNDPEKDQEFKKAEVAEM